MKKLLCSIILAMILGTQASFAWGKTRSCQQKLRDLITQTSSFQQRSPPEKINPIVDDRRSNPFGKKATLEGMEEGSPPSGFQQTMQMVNPWTHVKRLTQIIVDTPMVKKMTQKILSITWNPARLRYLRYMARRVSSSTWDRVRLVKVIKKLYEKGELSDEQVKALVEDPRIKNFSKHLEIVKMSREASKLVIHDYEVRTKISLIRQILNQIVTEDSEYALKDWRDFFFHQDLAIEELHALKKQLVGPIPYGKIIHYQSYISFVQSYRLDNNGLIVSGLNKVIPGHKRATSLEALKYIRQVDAINYEASVLSLSRSLVPKGPGARFLKKFRRYFKRVDKYYKKTFKKEMTAQKRINREAVAELDEEVVQLEEVAKWDDEAAAKLNDLQERRKVVELSNEEMEILARNNAIGKRQIYQRLYMGCRAMRKTNNHVGNFGRFAKFFIGIGLLFDGAGYVYRTPDGSVKKFSPEYWQQIAEKVKDARWLKILSYELVMSLVFSTSSTFFIRNPFAGKVEKSVSTYFMTSIIGSGDAVVYNRVFGSWDDHNLKMLEELVLREDFEQLQNRIWEILEAAGLDDEFLAALESAAQEQVEKTGEVYRPGEMSMGMIRHPAVQQVLKEVPSRIAEKREAAGAEDIDVRFYASLRGGISMQMAMEEIGEMLASPEKRQALDELRQYLKSINLEEKMKETLEGLAQVLHSRPTTTDSDRPALSPANLQEEKAQEIFLEALTQEIYKAQAGLIQTGSLGFDRFLFFRRWGVPASAKSILLGLYIYRVLCMGEGSLTSNMHAFGVKLIDNAFTSGFYWAARNCFIGKGKNPSFDEIFNPELEEKEDLCQDFFFKDERRQMRNSIQNFISQ